MKKIALLFPGVGSQYVGMSKSLYENFPIFKETVDEAGDILSMDISELFFSPEKKEELNRLENAQAALLTASIATYRVFMREIGIRPHFCMGHSLGEYSALCAAGVIRFPDALKLVRDRALVVNEAAKGIDGTMMWVINLDVEILEEVCRESQGEERVLYISAYDSPVQASISGNTDVLMKVAKKLEDKGAIVYPLKLSGPFHCPLMKQASDKMKPILQQYNYEQPDYTVIANRNAAPYNGAESVVDNLSLQLISPIRWKASIDYLLEQGTGIGIEIGPKNVLKFLMAKNTDAIKTYITNSNTDLDVISDELLVKEDEYLRIIGKCLGAAVSTKNNCDNNEEYEEKVIKPYRGVEAIFNQFTESGKRPGSDHVKTAIQMLRAVLAAKKVPDRDQEYWLTKVKGGKMINF